ncbi:MAG: helix-turn-helix domain-containing protein [Phycisphaerae bacterium]|nr:helix-turn-helix domain-containing protein [Phycisphaerae bacterium]
MIAGMREPVDAFARKLRELRKARGVTAHELSASAGVTKTYIGKWERERRQVNKAILQEVAEVLNLLPHERRELFMLADLRATPDAARDLYQVAADPDTNLLQALLGIDHEWPNQPTEPNTQSQPTRLLIDAVAGVLLGLELPECIFPSGIFNRLQWPEPITKLGLMPEPLAKLRLLPKRQCADPIDIPLAIIRQELPAVDRLRVPETAAESETFYLALGRALRRTLFSDTARVAELLRRMPFWSYERAPELTGVVRLYVYRGSRSLADLIKDGPFINDISVRVVAEIAERNGASCLRNCGRASLKRYGGRNVEWPLRFDAGFVELATLHAIGLSQTMHYETYGEGQSLRDAAYLTRYDDLWFKRVAEKHGFTVGDDPALEEQLRRGRLDEAMLQKVAAQPARIAAASVTAIDMYVDCQLRRIPRLPEDIARERQRRVLRIPSVPGAAKSSKKKVPDKRAVKATVKSRKPAQRKQKEK